VILKDMGDGIQITLDDEEFLHIKGGLRNMRMKLEEAGVEEYNAYATFLEEHLEKWRKARGLANWAEFADDSHTTVVGVVRRNSVTTDKNGYELDEVVTPLWTKEQV
jgi:hypothetical protein